MKTEIAPRNEQDVEQLLAKRLGRGRGYLTKEYDDEKKLLNKYLHFDGLMMKHAEKAMSAAIEAGKVLFAIRKRSPYGSWRPWLDKNNIHYKRADKLIKVAVYWEYFPEKNPDTGGSWSLSAAYDRLPEIKELVYDPNDDGGVGDELASMESEVDLLPKNLDKSTRKGGKRDPATTLKSRSAKLISDLRHQVEDMGRNDLAEQIVHMIADLEDILTKTNEAGAEHEQKI